MLRRPRPFGLGPGVKIIKFLTRTMSGILKFLWAEIITMSHDHGQNPNFLKSIHQFDHEHRENFGMSLAMVNALNYPPSPDLLLQTEKKKLSTLV